MGSRHTWLKNGEEKLILFSVPPSVQMGKNDDCCYLVFTAWWGVKTLMRGAKEKKWEETERQRSVLMHCGKRFRSFSEAFIMKCTGIKERNKLFINFIVFKSIQSQRILILSGRENCQSTLHTKQCKNGHNCGFLV